MRGPTIKDLPLPPEGKTGWPWTTESKQPPDKMPDGSLWPKVSTVTPSYNQGKFIEETIRSVLLQGYPNLEYIIIDGGSTDNSVEIIKKYSPWLTFWESEPDRGQSHAINKGFARAHGEIFSWVNSDDLLLPGAINHVIEVCHENPAAVAWVGGCYRIDPDGHVLKEDIPSGLERDNLANWWYGFFQQPSCFFAKWAWNQTGPLDESLHIAMDFDLWLRLLHKGKFISIPKMLSATVVHKEAKTQALRIRMRVETAVVQIKHGYQEIAIDRLIRDLERPAMNIRIRRFLKTKLKILLQCLGIWRPNKQNQRMQFLSEKLTF